MNNNHRKINFYTQGQRLAATGLLILWLVGICSLQSALAWGHGAKVSSRTAFQTAYCTLLLLQSGTALKLENRPGATQQCLFGPGICLAETTGPSRSLLDSTSEPAPSPLPAESPVGSTPDENGEQSRDQMLLQSAEWAANDAYIVWTALEIAIQLTNQSDDAWEGQIRSIKAAQGSTETVGRSLNELFVEVSGNSTIADSLNYDAVDTDIRDLEDYLFGENSSYLADSADSPRPIDTVMYSYTKLKESNQYLGNITSLNTSEGLASKLKAIQKQMDNAISQVEELQGKLTQFETANEFQGNADDGDAEMAWEEQLADPYLKIKREWFGILLYTDIYDDFFSHESIGLGRGPDRDQYYADFSKTNPQQYSHQTIGVNLVKGLTFVEGLRILQDMLHTLGLINVNLADEDKGSSTIIQVIVDKLPGINTLDLSCGNFDVEDLQGVEDIVDLRTLILDKNPICTGNNNNETEVKALLWGERQDIAISVSCKNTTCPAKSPS